MRTRGSNKRNDSLKLALCLVSIVTALIIQSVPSSVYAATFLFNRTDKMSSGLINAVATHEIGFTITDFATPVGSILIEFCANDPLPGTPCTPPAGFSAASTILASQNGETGFTIHTDSDANRIILTRFPVLVSNADVQYVFNNIVSPSTVGTFYARLQTFSSDDASGTAIQEGGIALSVDNQFNVNTEVPPFLRFCAGVTITNFDCSSATSFLIDLGEFSTTSTQSGQSQMVAVTNAASGLSITLSGTTLTSGTNTITGLAAQTASAVGSSQFGINLRANSSPAVGADPVGPGVASVNPNYNVPDAYRFQPGDIVASSTVPNDYRKFTVSFIANIDGSQPPGVYATTITFICLANF